MGRRLLTHVRAGHPMTGREAPTDVVRARLVEAVRALPSDLSAAEVLDRVPVMALVASHEDAAKAYGGVVSTLERAELDRVRPMQGAAPKHTSRSYRWLSVIALVLAMSAPALILTGRTGNAALDPISGALPAGLLMAASFGLFVWLEPRRTSNPLFHAGNFSAVMFVFFPVVWALGVFVVAGESEELPYAPLAVFGLVLQILSIVGCLVLAVFAFRHDRERPRWAAGRKVRTSSALPSEIAESPEYRAKLDHRLTEWRRHVHGVSTAGERAALLAAELDAVHLLAERGTITAEQRVDAEQRVRARTDWS
ncbi:hypothetical protein [Agromyces aureus]|uniref:Uncharacterized protein n=1 Tax=Agromyces aureus TaxID=453304 RepID=A0A191WI47_9MICO|nr:hypothetical protein [Agromyces aureus]ANJ27892.1 hypothetical protein ATC03_15385 [Agromyces aureus]